MRRLDSGCRVESVDVEGVFTMASGPRIGVGTCTIEGGWRQWYVCSGREVGGSPIGIFGGTNPLGSRWTLTDKTKITT